MLTTYTVYLRGPSFDQDAFEPVMCQASELMTRVREILKDNPACETAAVFLGDTELFQLKQPWTRSVG